jgi:hypothetical protein
MHRRDARIGPPAEPPEDPEVSMRNALAVLSVLVLAASASAATTIAVPRQQATIQAAVNVAATGDTIVVSAGVYRENVVVPIGKDGLTFKGAGAVIDGNINGVQGACLTVQSANVSVSGFRFRNGTTQIVGSAAGLSVTKCGFSDANGIGVDVSGDGAVVDGCRFDGLAGLAFRANGAAATMRNSSLRHCGGGGMDITGLNSVAESNTFVWVDDVNAIKITGDNARVTKNRFSMCDKECIRITGIASHVENNKGDRIDARLVNITSGDGAVVQNNVATWMNGGISVAGDNVHVLKNRVMHNSASAAVSVAGDNVEVSFNTVVETWNDADGVSVASGSATGGGTVEGNRVTDSAGIGLRLDTVNHLMVKSNSVVRCGDDNRSGIRLVGNGNSMTGCSTTEADEVGVYVSGDANVVTSCSSVGATEVGILVASGTGNSLVDCTASGAGLEGLTNGGLLTSVTRGAFRGERFDVTADLAALATFANPTLAGVSFKTGGAAQQSQY